MAGINASRLMVLIFSSNANGSPHVQREVERALHRGMTIIPFRIENVAPAHGLDYFLSLPNWLDAFTPPLEPHLRSLVKAVKELLQLPNTEMAASAATANVPHSLAETGGTMLRRLPKNVWIRTAAGAGVLVVVATALAAFWPTPDPPPEVRAADPGTSAPSTVDRSPADKSTDPEIERLSEAIRRNPKDDNAYFDRAMAHQNKGMHELGTSMKSYA
jgi:hypothetical protein